MRYKNSLLAVLLTQRHDKQCHDHLEAIFPANHLTKLNIATTNNTKNLSNQTRKLQTKADDKKKDL